MIYVLTGDDAFSRFQSLELIKRDFGDSTCLSLNSTVISGAEMTLDELRKACETMPFMAEKRLVIIEGLLERFDPRNRAPKKARSSESPDLITTFIDYFKKIPPFTVLVLVSGNVSPRNPLLSRITPLAEVRTFPPLRDEALKRWTEKRIVELKGSITPQAVDCLVRSVGSNLWILSSEIEKLLLYVADRRIVEDDVKAVVGYAQEANVFAMIDAILDGRAALAQQLLHRLLLWGAAPPQLLALLSRQAEQMVRAKELSRTTKNRAEIQAKLGIWSEFAVRRLLDRASGYSFERLKELYHRLIEADLAIKTGRYEGELALSLLIADLSVNRSGATKVKS